MCFPSHFTPRNIDEFEILKLMNFKKQKLKMITIYNKKARSSGIKIIFGYTYYQHKNTHIIDH